MAKPKLTVVRWCSWDEASALERSIGGLGGWFGFRKTGQRWGDYLDAWGASRHPYLEALYAEIVAQHLRTNGEWHQTDEKGVPVFSDGTAGLFSWRAWGDLQAAIWSTEEGVDYAYADFYMFEPPREIAQAAG